MGSNRTAIVLLVLAAAAGAWWFLVDTGKGDGKSTPAPPPAPGTPTAHEPSPAPKRLAPPRLQDVTWTDATLAEVVDDLVGRTGRRLHVSENVRKKLAAVRITLHIEDEGIPPVLARVLQPHGLGYSIRAQEILIFPDDD